MKRTGFEASREKRQAVNDAEASGILCDGMEVRLALVARMKAGELTPEQMLAELKRIKREGKKAGKLTRAQVFSRG